jgi:3-hydroxyacyl-CoA dehydrogenase
VSQPTPPEQLGIAGSGAIACGLARLAAPLVDTVLWARSDASAERVGQKLDGEARVTTDLAELADRTIVVEAIVEEMEPKAELLASLNGVLDDQALLASTTSSLSVKALADASGRPDRFGALHVFNPVHKMDLVELAYPENAAEDTRTRLWAMCEHLGKTVIEVPDIPGFVVNRLLFPFAFEAVRLMEAEGLEADAVDSCMRMGAGHPMGPLALLDFVGLDVSIAIGESIGADVPERLRDLVAQGKLGRKSGAGLHSY